MRDDDRYQPPGADRSARRRTTGRRAAARKAAERKLAARRAAGRRADSGRSSGRRPADRSQPPADPPESADMAAMWDPDRSAPARRAGPGVPAGMTRTATTARATRTARAARAAGTARSQRPRGAAPVGRRRRSGPPPGLYFGAAGVLVVVLVAAVAVLATGTKSGRPASEPALREPAASGAAPAAYSDSPSTRVFAGIDRRSADATPLTVREVFPRAARTLVDEDAGARLRLADSRLDGECTAAIWGRELGDALRRGGCSQVVRGAYVDKKAGYAALVAIINLTAAADANRVVDALGNNSAPGFVLPLAGAGGFGGRGFSVARGRAMGHYGVIGWVRRLDGKGDEQDAALLSLLVTVESPKAVIDRAAAARAAD